MECREHLEFLQKKFEEHLFLTVSKRTANKQTSIIGLFIDFICFDCVKKGIEIDEISVGMANSYFRAWYSSNIGDATESELKTAIKKFFIFLNQTEGIKNKKVLNSFKRK